MGTITQGSRRSSYLKYLKCGKENGEWNRKPHTVSYGAGGTTMAPGKCLFSHFDDCMELV